MTNRIEVYRGGGVPPAVLNQLTGWDSPEDLFAEVRDHEQAIESLKVRIEYLCGRYEDCPEGELHEAARALDSARKALQFKRSLVVAAKGSYREWLAQNHLCELKDFESLQVRVGLLEERLAQLERGREAA